MSKQLYDYEERRFAMLGKFRPSGLLQRRQYSGLQDVAFVEMLSPEPGQKPQLSELMYAVVTHDEYATLTLKILSACELTYCMHLIKDMCR